MNAMSLLRRADVGHGHCQHPAPQPPVPGPGPGSPSLSGHGLGKSTLTTPWHVASVIAHAPCKEPREAPFRSIPRGQCPAGHTRARRSRPCLHTATLAQQPGGIRKMQWSHSAGRGRAQAVGKTQWPLMNVDSVWPLAGTLAL